jgi:hypothetical protein
VSALEAVSSLALINQRLVELAMNLRRQSPVRSVVTAVTPRRYPSGDRVECYADVELQSGRSVGFWLEFRHSEGSWIVESSVRRSGEDGEDELISLPTRFAVEDDELVEELDGASAALVAAAEQLDLSLF